jgi:hypothetical protein
VPRIEAQVRCSARVLARHRSWPPPRGEEPGQPGQRAAGLRVQAVSGLREISPVCVSEDRHNPLPHIALSSIALKSAYRNTASLSTHSTTELQELQDRSGLEWRRPVLLRRASARGGIAQSVLSGKCAGGRPEMITGLHAGASGVTPGIIGCLFLRRRQRAPVTGGGGPGWGRCPNWRAACLPRGAGPLPPVSGPDPLGADPARRARIASGASRTLRGARSLPGL